MANEVAKKNSQDMERYIPASDILERADGWHIVVDMPGVAKEDLVLDLQDRELHLSAKSSYVPKNDKQNLRSEFVPAEYARTFALSDEVDREKIQAVLKEGVLDLFLPKADKAKPRKIEIKAG